MIINHDIVYKTCQNRFNISKSSFHISMIRTESALVRKKNRNIQMAKFSSWNPRDTSAFWRTFLISSKILGAIDGTHIVITSPTQLSHPYFNRKRFYSVILLASCNSNMEFNYLWTGNPGSCHDATVFKKLWSFYIKFWNCSSRVCNT